MEDIVCLGCDKSFKVYAYRKDTAKFCSTWCRRRRSKNICTQCGAPFDVHECRKDKAKFCSRACRNRRSKITCVQCGQLFEVYEYRKNSAKFCGHECFGKSKTGVPGNIKQISRIPYLKSALEQHVIKSDGCWGWSGYKDKQGYPKLSCGSRKTGVGSAHRASYIVHNGEIPGGLQVNHICNNPTCTNPKHLYIGTQADNIKDKLNSDRQAKGSNINTCKLTESDVIKIRSLLKSGVGVSEIAKGYKVTNENIYAVKNRVTWKYL